MKNFALRLFMFVLLSPMALAYDIEEVHLFEASQATGRLTIHSTTDLIYFEPLIKAFQEQNAGIEVEYTVLSSTDLFNAVNDSSVSIDLAISSAMDLQMKLANDGKTLAYRCLLYTSPSPRDRTRSRMPSSA